MKDKVLLSFLLCGLCVVACAQELIREFHFVNMNLNWTEARQFCRENYTDLATVTNKDDLNKLLRPASYSGDAWVGLSYVAYQNWASGYPLSVSWCELFRSDGFWRDDPCLGLYPFVCYRDSKEKSFFLVTTRLNWTDASTYCRKYYTDLALIQSQAENDEVTSLIVNKYNYAWFGSHRETWRWSDHSPVQFTNWQNGQAVKVSSCTVEGLSHYWRPESCDQRLPFFCYKDVISAKKKSNVVIISFRSDLDMSDPRNYRLLSLKIEEKLNQPGVKVTWKTPPKKKTTKEDATNCPANV